LSTDSASTRPGEAPRLESTTADRSTEAESPIAIETADSGPLIAAATTGAPPDRDSEGRGELRVTARSSTAFTIGAIVNGVLQFVFVVLITHTIDQRDAGALFEAMAIFAIGSNAAELGADTGLMRMMPIFHQQRRNDMRRLAQVAIGPALIVSALVGGLVYLFAPQLSNVFVHHASHAGTTTDLRVMALFIPAATGSTVICAGIRTWSARQPVLLTNFLVPLARPVLFAAFIAVGANAELAAFAWTIPLVAVLVLSAVALATHLGRQRPGPATTEGSVSSYRSIALQFWKFSLPRTFGAIFQILVTYIDLLLVGAYMSAKSAAAYSVASRYVLYSTFALSAVVSAVSTQLSRLMNARRYEKANAVYSSSTWWAAMASWPPLLVLAIFSPMFMTIFGHGYRIGVSALTIIALAMVVNVGTGPNGLLLLMAGRSSLNLLLQSLGLVINVGLNIWLIPILGLPGAAIAWTATILVTSSLASLILWRSFGITPFGRGYAIVCLAAGGCFGVLGLMFRLVFGTGVTTFAVFAVVSSCLYVAVVYRSRDALNLDAFESLYSRFQLHGQHLRSKKGSKQPTS
jgi:O-antigen/teichoic acid export membrane protein